MPIGFKHSEETKEKLRRFHTGLKSSEEARAKISKALLGRKLPTETVEKMRRWRTGRTLSPETRAKISHTHKTKGISKGRPNPMKGTGKGSEYKKFKDSKEYKQWRKCIFERDSYTCQHCGEHSGNGYRVELNADHIKPYCLFPELRLDIDNGRTLCRQCHTKTPTFGKTSKQMLPLFPELREY